MRLIDADALLEVLNKKSVSFNANVNDAILTAPTVDAVEVVRCKDCEFSPFWFGGNGNWKLCPLVDDFVKEQTRDDYCSYGKRREEEWQD